MLGKKRIHCPPIVFGETDSIDGLLHNEKVEENGTRGVMEQGDSGGN